MKNDRDDEDKEERGDDAHIKRMVMKKIMAVMKRRAGTTSTPQALK